MSTQSAFSVRRVLVGVVVCIAGLVAVVGGAFWWTNRPEAVGPVLCRRLAEKVRLGIGAEAADLVVGDSVRVTPQDDGSYRIGLTIQRKTGGVGLPFYCQLTSVNGQWRAVAVE